MITVRRLDPAQWPLWRTLRLRALEESPEAFSSTLAGTLERDAQGGEAYWREAVAAPMIPLVADVDDAPVGMCRLLLTEDLEGAAELLSVWVAPEVRGRGVGRALVSAAVDHLATRRPHPRLLLAVAESGAPARSLYERCGFAVTGPNPEDGSELLMEHRSA